MVSGGIAPMLLHSPQQQRLLPPPSRADYEPHRMLTTMTQVRAASEQLRVAPRQALSQWEQQIETVRTTAEAVHAQGERLSVLEREFREVRGALLRVESMLELLLPKEAPISSTQSAPNNSKRKYSDAAAAVDEESTALM